MQRFRATLRRSRTALETSPRSRRRPGTTRAPPAARALPLVALALEPAGSRPRPTHDLAPSLLRAIDPRARGRYLIWSNTLASDVGLRCVQQQYDRHHIVSQVVRDAAGGRAPHTV